MNSLVIIGPTHHNTYGMIRCFGEVGIKPNVIVYGSHKSYVLRSAFIGMSHVATDSIDAVRKLRENYTEAVVIACSDEIASLMDKQYDELSQHFVFFNCGIRGGITKYMDKAFQVSVAQSVGLSVPLTYRLTTTTISRFDLPYPCILRPLESINGGKIVKKCLSPNDLPLALRSFNVPMNILVQEFIERDYEIVVVGLSYEDRIVIPAFIHKHRDTNGGTTFSTVKPIEILPKEVLLSCKEYIKQLNYSGLFGIELIKKGESYYFVEINMRSDATTYAVCVAGCNLPLAYWNLANHKSIDEVLCAQIHQIYSMVEFNDFIHVLKRQVRFFTWVKQRKRAECTYCYCRADKYPFFVQLFDFIRFLIKRVFRYGRNK